MNGNFNQFEIEKIREEVKKYLTKDAYERLARIRLIKPELALQIELNLYQLIKKNKLKKVINEEEMKKLLEMLREKREFRLIR
jgi:programmed cell death protein 5